MWCWGFILIFSIILLLYSTQVNTNTALPYSNYTVQFWVIITCSWTLTNKYEEYFQKISLGQFLTKHTERNVVLVIHLDIFNHIIIIFKSSQHRHGIAPFRMRFFQITWYNFEYHLRCVCVAQALKFFCALILLFFVTPLPFWSCNRLNVIQKKTDVLVSILGKCK